MTTLPASVTIVDLPAASLPLTGAELFEAVQTNAGVGQSVQVVATAIFTTSLGALPTGGSTGQLLSKTSGTNFAAAWTGIVSFVAAGTALATSGSVTSVVLSVATAGISSTQIANNAVGTNQLASSLGIASSLSVGTLLTVGGTATVTGTTILNGGLQVTGTSILTGSFGVVGTAQFTGSFNVVGTTNITGVLTNIGTAIVTGGPFSVLGTSTFTGTHLVNGTAVFTSTLFGVVGTALMTGTHGVVGTAQFTGNLFAVSGTSQFTGVVGIAGTTIVTGTFILPTLTAGILAASSTGVISTTGSGAMTLLNTLTPNGVSSATDTTSLTGTYTNYMVTFENVAPANNTVTFQMQVATTGSAFQTTTYNSLATINAAQTIISDFGTGSILLSGTRATSTVTSSILYGVGGSILINNPSGTVTRKMVNGSVFYVNATTPVLCMAQVGGYWDGNSNAITGISFLFSSGNIATGVIKIYGIT